MDKEIMMDNLKIDARELCAKTCDPVANLVWGEGSLDACVVLVGEAPGAQEAQTGRPFAGRAGMILNIELARAGLCREDIYLTNVIKCRSTQTVSGRIRNRPPRRKETNDWLNILLRELSIIEPRVILCLGSTAASALIHPGFKIISERGKWFDGLAGERILATYHPAYIGRFSDIKRAELFHTDLITLALSIKMNGLCP